MSAITAIWRDNPVLTKELRVRMRGARAYWILTGYLAFLSLILFFQYMGWWNETVRQGSGFTGSSRVGREFFYWIAGVQAFLVAFITPAVTSGGITIEKEQRTLEMLEMTRLPASAVVAGKLMSAIGFVALLLISSLPLTCLCFFLGGVSPQQVAYSYLLLFVGSFVAGALGLVWSSFASSTATAVVFTYASLIVPPIIFIVFLGTMAGRGHFDDQIACALAIGLYGIPWPDTFGYLSSFFTAWDMRHYFGLTLPAWVVPFLSYMLIGLLLAAVATMRIKSFPERHGRIVRILLAAVFVEQLFFYFGGRFFVYSASAPPGLAIQLAPYPLLSLLFYPVMLLLVCVPVFSTFGPSTKATSREEQDSRRGRSGFPYLLGLFGLVFGMYALSFAIVGQPGAVLSGKVAISGYKPVAAPRNITAPGGIIVANPWVNPVAGPSDGRVLPVAVSLLAAVIGLSGIGWLLSVLTRNRWAAMLLSYAFLVMVFLVPTVARANYLSDTTVGASFLINLLYLNPMSALSEATNVDGGYKTLPLLLQGIPVWMVTTAAYAGIAFITGLIAVRIANRRAVRRVHAV